MLTHLASSNASAVRSSPAGVGAARLRKVSDLVLGLEPNDLLLDAQEKVLLANLLSLRVFQIHLANTRITSGLSTGEFASRIGLLESEVLCVEQQLSKVTIEQLLVHLMGLGFVLRIDQHPGLGWQVL